jgi:hypothetical protein
MVEATMRRSLQQAILWPFRELRLRAERKRCLSERDRALTERKIDLRVGEPKIQAVGGSLYEFSLKHYSGDKTTKHPTYYQRYDRAFAVRNFRPASILEVGVHVGESTKVFSSAFPEAKIVAIDKASKEIDFSDYRWSRTRRLIKAT